VQVAYGCWVWVPQLPDGLRWSHNSYYHRWLLRQLPSPLDSALDVGCGAGRLACTLASRAKQVDAVDASAAMIAGAEQRGSDSSQVRWLVGDVLDRDVPLREEGYHAVVAVSSLHHLPLDNGLGRLAGLVRPGGVLAVIGHYRPDTIADRLVGIVALPANVGVGVALAVIGGGGKPDDDGMPVRPPTATLAEIRQAATRLPGSTVTRALYWRYLLAWRRAPAH